MDFIQFFKENSTALIVVAIPFSYFILRDVVSLIAMRKKAKQDKERLIESDRRLYALFQKMQQQRFEMENSVKEVDQNMEALLKEYRKEEQKAKETKKKPTKKTTKPKNE